jgi:hypothetical protein
MGETLQPVTPRFNRSLRVESRSDRLTGEPGAVLLREVLEASGIVQWMAGRLVDPRRQEDVTHDLASLLRTTILLPAQGWRDHDDADALRHDPAMRLATSSSAGLTPLVVEKGLASQPTLSRFTAIMADPAPPLAVAVPLHRPGLPAVAKAAEKAVQFFVENGLDGAADSRPQSVLDRVEAVIASE